MSDEHEPVAYSGPHEEILDEEMLADVTSDFWEIANEFDSMLFGYSTSCRLLNGTLTQAGIDRLT